MNIAVLGTTSFTVQCYKQFICNNWNVSCIISLPKEKCPLNSIDLKKIAKEDNILYYETSDINSKETEKFLLKLNLDYIFSTWPYIIKQNILQIPKYFVIGSHPTQLPFNRGRHPLHWLISLGIPNSYMSLFIMDNGIDSGNILVQEYFSCNYDYGINDVYEKMTNACEKAIKKLCMKLEGNPNYIGVEQDSYKVNYWRKKNIFDVMIDFRMSALDIVRLVKSFNQPYSCAVLLYQDNLLRVENAEVFDLVTEDFQLERLEPGKIIKIQEKTIFVKTSDKIIKLYCIDMLENINFKNYIYPPAQYIRENYEVFKQIL